jgi:ATP-dependent protease Clp ATPase subunit
MKQFLITPSAGKRLIAKTLANHPAIRKALKNGTIVIVAGTTNGYVAEEILNMLGVNDFSRKHFFRGITVPSARS